jgi:hypothetical protein
MFQSLENRNLKSSNRWKFFAVLFPMLGSLAMAQGPGSLSQGGFFQAWWGAQTISPDQIAGLEWWIDSADSTSISLQAGTNLVSQWDDKSGNGKHLTQSTSGNRPRYIESVKNGNSVIRFSGGNVAMTVPSSTALFNYLHQSNTTVFMVFNLQSSASSLFTLMDNNQRAFGAGYSFYIDNRKNNAVSTNGMIHFITRGSLNFVVDNRANNAASTSIYHSVLIKSNPTELPANRSEVFFEDTFYKNNSSSQAVLTANTIDSLSVGNVPGSPAGFIGDICEIIIYSGILSNADTARVRNYLKAKWGL